MFGAACAYVESVEVLDESVQLQLYGLYKQATVGTCTSARPSIFDWVGRAKHDAWSKLGDMHSTTAQNMYVQLVDRIDPMWRNAVRGGGVGGAVVSRFADMEEEEEEDGTSEMTDAAVRGNVKRVQEIIEVNKCAVDQQDVLGRT
jgi:acyl-CoA-binding protein